MKKRIFLFLSKKYIILSALTIFLGVAVFINWQFANDNPSITVQDIFKPKNATNYGEAELVSKDANKNYKFFDEARLNRKKSVDESNEKLAEILNASETPQLQKSEAANKILKANELTKQETLINQKILTDCQDVEDSFLFFDDKGSVFVTIKMKPNCTLSNSQTITKIKDIVSLTAKVPASEIFVNEYQLTDNTQTKKSQ